MHGIFCEIDEDYFYYIMQGMVNKMVNLLHELLPVSISNHSF